MSTSSLTLTQLPVNDISEILKRCDIENILVLRKTCHNLRNFINNSKPDRVLDIEIRKYITLISLKIGQNHQEKQKIEIHYEEHESGCLFTVSGHVTGKNPEEKRQKILENANYTQIFFEDLQTILDFQISPMNYLHLNLCMKDKTGFMEQFETMLKNRQFPIKTKEIALYTDKLSETLQVLPYLDSNCLENLKFTHARSTETRELMTELVNLDQWKNAKSVEIWDCLKYMNNLLHFSEVVAFWNITNSFEFAVMTNKFLQSAKLNIFDIQFPAFLDDYVLRALGPNYHVDTTEPDKRSWYIRIDGQSEKCLKMDFAERHSIQMSYINTENVSFPFLIQDPDPFGRYNWRD